LPHRFPALRRLLFRPYVACPRAGHILELEAVQAAANKMASHSHSRLFKAGEAQKLEDPERLAWLPPADVLRHLNLRPGMRVADVGAGTGYFALPIARELGPNGRVFAVDLQREMLRKLAAKLESPAAPQNILLIEGDATRINLPDRSCDLVFMANVWHELDDRAAALREARRILLDGGRLVILDWRSNAPRPPASPIEHRISRETVARTLRAHHWTVERSRFVGRYSYLLIARRPVEVPHEFRL
jgi:SAM-dependent methyltransferase